MRSWCVPFELPLPALPDKNEPPPLPPAAAEGKYELTVVSPRTFFLYTPLLPSAAAGSVQVGPDGGKTPNQLAKAAAAQVLFQSLLFGRASCSQDLPPVLAL